MSAMNNSIDRRDFVKIGAAAAVIGALGGSLAGCGGSASSTTTASASAANISGVTLGMLNYEDWMGSNEVSDFKKQTGCAIKQYATPDGGDSAWVKTISKNTGTYDFALAGIKVASSLNANKLLASFDASKVANLSKVSQTYIEQFPYGIPVDQGKVGFMYNTELLPNPPKSWAELFANASQYHQKLIFPDFDVDVIDAGLMSLGIDINTEKTSDIDAAQKAIIAIKSHIKAFIDNGGGEQVADGSAMIAVGYDYEFAANAADSSKIAWVSPSEGMYGYLEGWVPLASSKNLDAIYEFMNFHLETTNYADFIDTTSASWVESDITGSLDSTLSSCAALQPADGKVTFQKKVSAEVTQAISSAYQEIQNA